MNVAMYKVASFEINDIPLIEYIASKGKPIILSTGIATLSDIELAVATCRKAGNHQLALLKCSSAYPTPIIEVNLRTIPNLAETFNTIVGISDHTLGISVPVAAVALGAKIIEKHFIINRTLGGPDSAFSLEFEEFKAMVQTIREVEQALGEVNYELTEKQKKSKTFSRSLFVVEDIKKGEPITEKNVRSIRPFYGLAPVCMKDIIGKKIKRNITKGTPVTWDIFE
jgi:pseudaminic acid synthase